MSYLPNKYASRAHGFDNPVIDFLQAYQPDDREDARKFRESLIKSINYYLPNGNKVAEHPDSHYLEP
jgi:hypothetical protein